MIITRATAADVDTILAWRAERRRWLARRGSDQWSTMVPRWAVGATVASGQTWMVFDDERPAATITLTAWEAVDGLWKPAHDAPDALWLEEDNPDDALYASKMMVPVGRRGQGLGPEMLAWAAGRAFDNGLTWLRLDAWTSNTELHRYYQRLGFRHVRTVASRLSGACFQRATQPYDGWLKTEGR